jgi:hypothetical protein
MTILTDYERVTDEELDACEHEWREWMYGHMQEYEEEWTRGGLAFHWLDPEPAWVSPCDWRFIAQVPDPHRAAE